MLTLLPQFTDTSLSTLQDKWIVDKNGLEYQILTKPKHLLGNRYTCLANVGYLAFIEITLTAQEYDYEKDEGHNSR